MTIYDISNALASAKKLNEPFDPINHALDIYLNAINIFIRILAESSSNHIAPDSDKASSSDKK